MTISAILTLALGIVLLLFGRRAFWIFVAVAGFIAGLTFATLYYERPVRTGHLVDRHRRRGHRRCPRDYAGVVGHPDRRFPGRRIPGDYAGSFFGYHHRFRELGGLHYRRHYRADPGGRPVRLGDHHTVRAAGGGPHRVWPEHPASTYYWVIFLVLIVVGIVVQAGFWHRRYPVKRTWGRRQSTKSLSK